MNNELMNNESMNENMSAKSIVKKEMKKGLIIALIVVLAVISCNCLFMGVMYKLFVPISWSRFSEKRIEYIEDNLKLDLDNVEPLSYREITAQDFIAEFDFKVDDYKSFMENDFHGGAIIRNYEDYSKGYVYVCLVEDMSSTYSKCFEVGFTKEGDGYKAHLYCYRNVGTMSEYYKETTTSE